MPERLRRRAARRLASVRASSAAPRAGPGPRRVRGDARRSSSCAARLGHELRPRSRPRRRRIARQRPLATTHRFGRLDHARPRVGGSSSARGGLIHTIARRRAAPSRSARPVQRERLAARRLGHGASARRGISHVAGDELELDGGRLDRPLPGNVDARGGAHRAKIGLRCDRGVETHRGLAHALYRASARRSSRAERRLRRRARAAAPASLTSVSASSAAGSESRTTPTPA